MILLKQHELKPESLSLPATSTKHLPKQSKNEKNKPLHQPPPSTHQPIKPPIRIPSSKYQAHQLMCIPPSTPQTRKFSSQTFDNMQSCLNHRPTSSREITLRGKGTKTSNVNLHYR